MSIRHIGEFKEKRQSSTPTAHYRIKVVRSIPEEVSAYDLRSRVQCFNNKIWEDGVYCDASLLCK